MSDSSLQSTHPNSFVHLHLHTQYSLLDGAIRLKDLIPTAKEMGDQQLHKRIMEMFGTRYYIRCKKLE